MQEVRYLISMMLSWLLVMSPMAAQSEPLEKVVLLKCKGRLTLSYQVDLRRERNTTEELFAAEVHYKGTEPLNIRIVGVGLSGTSFLPCKASNSFLFCETNKEVVTVFGEPPFKGTVANASAKYSFSTKATMNRLTGLMKFEHLSTVEKTEPERGTSRHQEDGLFECQVGTKPLF
jgi:hypothetical protein